MDETGRSGDTGPIDGGSESDPRDRARVNGWASPDSPWSNAGSALDPADDEIPAWRRPSQEIRPFARQPLPPDHQASEPRPFPGQHPAEVRPFASPPSPFGGGRPAAEEDPWSRWSGEVRRPEPEPEPVPSAPVSAPAAEEAPAPGWSDNRTRYADLLHHFAPAGSDSPPAVPSRFEALTRPGVLDHAPAEEPDEERGGERRDPLTRPGTLEEDDRRTGRFEAPPPASAPPYPYEGDLDDARRDAGAGPPPATQQRAAMPLDRPRPVFPAVRPATPGGRRVDWLTTGETARHAAEQTGPRPIVEPRPPVDLRRSSGEVTPPRPSYDSSSLPNRSAESPAYPASAAYSGPSSAGDPGTTPIGDQVSRTLPQRVPAEPDVPTVPEPPSVEPTAETPALARIATHLRRGDVLPAQERQDGFDVSDILEAVREVDGVRDASLRSTPAGAHSLRLDLAEGADPAEVSRHVARLLQDRMGLDAAMKGAEAPPLLPRQEPGPVQATATVPPPTPLPEAPTMEQPKPVAQPVNSPPATAFVPSQAGPAGRATVPAAEDLRRLPTIPQAGRAPMREAEPAEATVETVSSGKDCAPARPLEVNERPGPRVVIENVQVNTFGTEATVEVRLAVAGRTAAGLATGPAVDGYLLRLCAMATAAAVDDLLSSSDHADGPARCFVEHAASVPFGPMQVAVVVLLLSCGGWVEQLAGSAVVTGDDRHAMVRATLAAVNRRLEALLS